MAANGISTKQYKRDRQLAKLEIAEAKRQGKTVTAAGGAYTITGTEDATKNSYRPLNVFDTDLLPTLYAVEDNNTNNVVDNPNTGGLSPYRPWENGYQILAASFITRLNIESQDSDPTSVYFRPDGTKMFLAGYENDKVYQYSLSTAWDIRTASYDNDSFFLGSQDTLPLAIHFKPDGTKMYMLGFNSRSVHQYSLPTPWEISTASYDSVDFPVASQDIRSFGIHFKPDGSKLYVVGYQENTVSQYTLGTAWDLSTASYDDIGFSVVSEDSEAYAVSFNQDGSTMYIVGGDTNTIYQYSLATNWDVSTAAYDRASFSLDNQSSNTYGVFLRPDGTAMYTVNRTRISIDWYNIGV